MSITFNFQAPNTQTGGDDVDQINIYESDDATAFTLVSTDTILPTDTSYIYAAGDVTKYYRFSFTDTDGFESPQSDTLFGGDVYMSSVVSGIVNVVRFDIGDDDSSNYKYSDTQMRNFVDKAVNTVIKARVGTEDWPYIYASGDITPSLTTVNDKNTAVKDLIAKCIEKVVYIRDYKSAIAKSIFIKDGDTAIRTTGGLSGFKDIIGGTGGINDEYEQAIRSFIGTGGDGSGGAMVAYY